MERPRKMVSYFEHEDVRGKGYRGDVRHLEEIKQSGFNSTVVCYSETSVANPNITDFLSDFVTEAKEVHELSVIADPWGIGEIFGGEQRSPYAESGSLSCFCEPKFDQLVEEWLISAKLLGFERIFWDEPEKGHRNGNYCSQHGVVELLDHFTNKAANYGMANSVCLPADPSRYKEFEQVASLENVDDIGTDPYHPNVFYRVPTHSRKNYYINWGLFINEIAKRQGINCHAWIKGFNIKRGGLGEISESVQAMRSVGVNDLAVWGFRGCKSLFGNQEGVASPKEVWEKAVEEIKS